MSEVELPARVPLYALRPRLPWPLWALYRALRITLVSSAFAGFWLIGTLFAWSVLPLVALVAGKRRARACLRLVSWSFRFFHGYMRALRLLEVRFEGTLPAELGSGPVVFVANHTTLVDVTAIIARIPDLSCVAKTAMASSPFIGRLIRLCGFIDSGLTVAARAASVDTAVARLKDGFHVLVFPEGTRSPEGSMHRFQRGPFEIACRANVPVVPLVLRCNPSALRREQPFWAQPDTCAILTVSIHSPVSPEDFGHKSRAMRDAVESHYRRTLRLDASREEVRTGSGGAKPEES